MKEYPFSKNLSDTGYCVFPKELEDDELTFFHATPAENVPAILKEGFKADPEKSSGLWSVSFAKRSVSAFDHAMRRRGSEAIDFVILAVRYENLDQPHITQNSGDIHDYCLDPAPQIIGYVKVPASYRHV